MVTTVEVRTSAVMASIARMEDVGDLEGCLIACGERNERQGVGNQTNNTCVPQQS